MTTRKRADPVLGEGQFPHAMGDEVNVEYDGAPWAAKIHRIAVDEASCTVKYIVDGSMEPSVSPSRINQAAPGALAPIPEPNPLIAEPATVEEEEAVPSGEPVFVKRSSIAQLNRYFSKLMKARLKRLKHKCKWCCHLRHDMPYFSAEATGDGTLKLTLVHGTVDMTSMCNLSEWGRIKAIDEYLYLHGELLSEAHRISSME